MIHVLSIPDWRPTTLDKLLYATVRDRIHLKKEDRTFIAFYAKNLCIPKATGRRRVTLEIGLTGRQKEADIDAYQKTVLDALVECGLLLGDTRAEAEWGGVSYSRGESFTAICLEDC